MLTEKVSKCDTFVGSSELGEKASSKLSQNIDSNFIQDILSEIVVSDEHSGIRRSRKDITKIAQQINAWCDAGNFISITPKFIKTNYHLSSYYAQRVIELIDSKMIFHKHKETWNKHIEVIDHDILVKQRANTAIDCAERKNSNNVTAQQLLPHCKIGTCTEPATHKALQVFNGHYIFRKQIYEDVEICSAHAEKLIFLSKNYRKTIFNVEKLVDDNEHNL